MITEICKVQNVILIEKRRNIKKKTLIVKIEIKIKMDDNEHSFIN